jgi:S1-C subfamily serine protease
VVEDIMEYGNVQKGMLGISALNPNTPFAIDKGITDIEGVYVETIQEDSGAADADIRSGDIIKEVDGVKIKKFADLIGYVATKRPGDQVSVTVDRDGESLVLPVTLKEMQSLVVANMGLEVKNLSDKEKKKFNTKKGVIITGVPEQYRGYGLDGKVILAIDGEEISNIGDAKRLFENIPRYGKTSITMLSEKGEREKIIFQ